MQTRTWPYGTVKAVRVDNVDIGRYQGEDVRVVVVCDISNKEAFILVGDKSGAYNGDIGYIEFKQGGPTGGFWVFTAEKPIGN